MGKAQDFLAEAYSYARQAGLPDSTARLAVAQAAHETGFGRSVKGNNYFGIKAGKSWTGPVQGLKTWEEVGGKRVNIRAAFRKYESPVQAFKDWAKLIERNWPGALRAKTFTGAVAGLKAGQQGGYATDTKYDKKMARINAMIERTGVTKAYGDYPNHPVPTPAPPRPGTTIPDQYAYAGQTRALQPSNPIPGAYRELARSMGSVGLASVGGRDAGMRTFGTPAPGPVQRAPLSAVRSASLPPVARPSPAPVAVSRNYPSLGGVRQAISPTPGARLAPTAGTRLAPAPAARVSPTQGVRVAPVKADQRLVGVEMTPKVGAHITAGVQPVATKSKLVSAYGQYAASRLAAPAQPVGSMPVAPAAVRQVPIRPVAPIQPQTVIQPRPIYQAPQGAAPPAALSLSPADIYAGTIGSARALGGNIVSRDQYGNTSVTNAYGVTTKTTPGGYQSAPSFSGLGKSNGGGRSLGGGSSSSGGSKSSSGGSSSREQGGAAGRR